MSENSATARLLGSIRNLLYAQTLLGRIGWALFAGLLVGVAALLAGRLTGYFSQEETRWALAVGPGLTVLLVLLVTRRPDSRRAATEVDRAVDSGDLFLTTVTAEGVQEFSPLVREQADTRASKLQAGNLVGIWDRVRPGWVAGAIVAALVADLFTPILDPFGVVEQAEATTKARKALAHDIEQVEIRKAELKKDEEEGDLSPEVEQALERLLEDMPELVRKPKAPQAESIKQAQRQLGELWEKVSDRLAEQMLSKEASGQRFGGEEAEKFNDWKEDLKQGKADSLKSEFDEIKDLLEKAKKEAGTPEAAEAMRMAEKKMADLKKFAEQELGAPELAEAIERAMRQMDAAQSPELQAEAMQALAESTELGELEAEALAEAARDMEALKEALETLEMMSQMQKMRGEGEFDPTEMDGMNGMSDYAEFYRQMLARNSGMGTGGEGQGDSEAVDEDDTVSTGFKKEVAESYLQKGRMLMSLKGMGEGIQNEDEERQFREVAESLEQEALEAVETEGIPPGYRDGIKSYFRSIGRDGVGQSGEAQ